MIAAKRFQFLSRIWRSMFQLPPTPCDRPPTTSNLESFVSFVCMYVPVSCVWAAVVAKVLSSSKLSGGWKQALRGMSRIAGALRRFSDARHLPKTSLADRMDWRLSRYKCAPPVERVLYPHGFVGQITTSSSYRALDRQFASNTTEPVCVCGRLVNILHTITFSWKYLIN